MIYLLLCVMSTAGIMVVFKIAGRQNLDTFRIIVINYFVAAALGFGIDKFPGRGDISAEWLPMAITIGILFIVMFFVIALSTQKAGIAVTSVASKMSVVIPIVFSIFYFKEPTGILKITGIIMAMIAVFMTSYNREKSKKRGLQVIYLPLLLFLGTGLIDSLIKYTQEVKLTRESTIMFSSILFSISAVTGVIFSFFRRTGSRKNENYLKVLLAGLVLGIVNFGSLYGIIMALDSNFLDSSIIFGINNMGVVVFSVILALAFFNEKLNLLNKAGIALSIITIIFLSYI